MMVTITLPERVQVAIAKTNQQKREKALKLIENKIIFLYRNNSYNIYSDVVGYTFFDNFLLSFVVMKNDGKEVEYFVDEDLFTEYSSYITENENDLFGNLLGIGKRDDYILRFDNLRVKTQVDLEEYLSNSFWKDFDKEGR